MTEDGRSAIDRALADTERYLTPSEVARVFRVDAKTVTRWASPGRNGEPPKLASTRTPGGHHRFRESDVVRFLREGKTTAAMTIRNVNGVPISDHMIRRLGVIAEKGSISRGCQNCENLTVERLADAGLLDYEPTSNTYRLTERGYELLADVGEN